MHIAELSQVDNYILTFDENSIWTIPSNASHYLVGNKGSIFFFHWVIQSPWTSWLFLCNSKAAVNNMQIALYLVFGGKLTSRNTRQALMCFHSFWRPYKYGALASDLFHLKHIFKVHPYCCLNKYFIPLIAK